MSLLRMFLSCLRIGATGFGGPMALISLLQEEFVERRKAVSTEEFAEGVAIGGILPGPIAIDAAVYVGYRLHGWWGAFATASGLILPPFVMMLAVTPAYFHLGRLPQFEGFLMGVRPAVIAVIAAASWRLGKRGVKGLSGVSIAAFVFVATLVCAGVADLAPGWGWSPNVAPTIKALSSIGLIVLSGALGLLFLGRADAAPPARPTEGKAPQP